MKILPCLRLLLLASRAVALADQQSAAVIVEPKRKPHLYNSHSTIVLAVQPFTSSHLNCLLRHLWNLQWIESSDAVAFQLLLLMAGGDENLISPRGQDGQDGSKYRVNLDSTGCGRSLEKGQQPSAELEMNIFDKQIATGKRLNFFCGPFFVLFIWFWFGHVLNGL